MKTLKLQINNRIYDKLLWLLSQFNTEDLQIIRDEDIQHKEYLDKELKKIDEGKATFLSIEELDELLEKSISKYESENS